MTLCLNSKIAFERISGIGFNERIDALNSVFKTTLDAEKCHQIFERSYGNDRSDAIEHIKTESVKSISVTSTITSIDNDIILYIYFQDLIDLDAIELISNKQVLYFAIYPFMDSLNFDNIFDYSPANYGLCEGITGVYLRNIDYFTLYIKSLDAFEIKGIKLYGKRNQYNTRKLDKVEIKWQSTCKREHEITTGSDILQSDNLETKV